MSGKVQWTYCRELCRISPRWYQTRRRKEPPGSLLSSSPGWRMAASGGKWKFCQITFKFAPIISTSYNQGGGAGEHGRGRVSLHQQGHVCRLQGRSWLCSGLNWKYSKELPDNWKYSKELPDKCVPSLHLKSQRDNTGVGGNWCSAKHQDKGDLTQAVRWVCRHPRRARQAQHRAGENQLQGAWILIFCSPMEHGTLDFLFPHEEWIFWFHGAWIIIFSPQVNFAKEFEFRAEESTMEQAEREICRTLRWDSLG